VRFVRVLGLLAVLSFPTIAAIGALPPELGPVKGRVVWLDFWASWCTPCRHSFPWMNTMQQKYAVKGLEIVAVNLDKQRALADGFLQETPARFAVRFDPDGKLAKQFDVQAMPSSYLLDASGKVIARHFGFKLADTDEYERQIEAALAAARD
jgi:cytochrome c biogenesis protein CcmG, thiol:disulfide interchange protein DsbE